MAMTMMTMYSGSNRDHEQCGVALISQGLMANSVSLH